MVDRTEQQVSEVYAELNRQDSPRPPTALDAAILAEAHRAVRAGPKPVRPSFYRWAPPFAVAATVVLATTIVLLAPPEQYSTDSQMRQQEEAAALRSADAEAQKARMQSRKWKLKRQP